MPYFPPPPFKGSFLPLNTKVYGQEHKFYPPYKQSNVDKIRLKYNEYVLFSDHAFRSFIGNIKKAGLYDNSLIIATADHGENFNNGWWTHGSPMLFEPEIHIPLMIHMPGQRDARRVQTLAELVDLAPTILDIIDRAAPPWMEGESLLPYIEGETLNPEKTVYSLNNSRFENLKQEDPEVVVTAIRGDYKLFLKLSTGETGLYNIKRDKAETLELSTHYPKITGELKKLILDKIEGHGLTNN